MLPTEPPLSLHRLVAPVPPARVPEAASATHQMPAPAPAPVSNATAARTMQASAGVVPYLKAAQDQTGNAVVAKIAGKSVPVVRPLLTVPLAPKL
jgi:hypothetical protein